jgi:alpha/beta superfamily hydrolase
LIQPGEIIHEQVRFGNEGYLAGVLSYPAIGSAALAVLVCSPHPNFGGDMENNVVAALAERLSAEAITLRFDYRGVGQSRIDLPPGLSVFDYWENVEQTLDYTEPLADTAAAVDELSSLSAGLPMIAVGYSFGAIMATRIGAPDPRIVAMVGVSPPLKRVGFEHLSNCPKPCLLVSGQDDFVYDAEVAKQLVDSSGCNLTFETPVADHFFIGLEPELAERIARFIHQQSARAQMEGPNGSR